MRGIVVRAVGMFVLLAGSCLSAAPANAQCSPDPAASGQTVTCSGSVPNGFQAGGGIDNLTVNVLPTATVSDGGGGAAISVNDFNTVTNSGALTAGAPSYGIFAGVNNTVTNTGTGTITVGDNSTGIRVFGNSTVTNAGAITSGLAAVPVVGGISAINDDNNLTNTPTGTITVGDGAVGIFAHGDRATVSNAGAITAGGYGIRVRGDDATVSSNGTITGTDHTFGMNLRGDHAVISNAGVITAGDFSTGIDLTGDDATVSSSGSPGPTMRPE